MNRTFLSITMAIASAFVMNAEGFVVSNPANLTGKKYVNPVIHADYSDPDVAAAPDGKTFYMTASSFHSVPGLPILKSTDLVNWEIVNYALGAVPPADYYASEPRHGKGVWAPCIKYHDGQYYIYWGDPDFGIYMIKTDNPESQWSEPVLVKAGKGLIDPSPLWDDDGNAYLANGWAASRAGFNSVITISRMSADGTKVLSAPRIVFDGNDGVNHTVEGPKMYKRNGYYYIFSPAGGVVDGWQLVMRSKDIYGPYKSKIVMAQGKSDINGPHQGAWIETANSEDWFLHFQDKGLYGRIIHLNPMAWVNDWPVIGNDADGDGCGDAVRSWQKPELAPYEPSASASDDDRRLPYQWHGNYTDFFGFPITHGLMRIYGHRTSDAYANLWEVPNLWLQKFPAETFRLTAKTIVSAKSASEGISSGVVVMGLDYARLGLKKSGDAFIMQFATCKDADRGSQEEIEDLCEITPTRVYSAGLHPNMEAEVYFRVDVEKDGLCKFYYSLDGRKFFFADQSTARVGKWIGAKIGFYSITPANTSDRGWIDIIDSNIN